MQRKQEESKNSKLWGMYESGKNYFRQIGLADSIPEFSDFYEGRQWVEPTKNTLTLPRPTFNFIEMFVDNKVANVMGSPIKLNFIAENDTMITDYVTKFSDYICKEMNLADINDRAAQEGAIKGTYIIHFYWDEEALGKRGNYVGGVRAEIIDVLDFIVANPNEPDVQKQKWIMIVSREEVKKVREMADKNINKSLITPDELDTEYQDKEQDGIEMCTVLTRYFRINGEVYFEKAVKGTIVHKPVPFNPYLVLTNQNKEEDGEVASQPDNTLEKNKPVSRYKAILYPVAVGNWKKRHKSIYGRGEVETLINVQKSVNFIIAMQILNTQETGWSKLLVKHNALKGQTITNEPGQILYDHTPGAGFGIQRLEGQPLTAANLSLAPQLLDLIRTVSNSGEVITGDMLSKDLSGVAIAQLQAQSQKPISRLQKNFWKTQEQIGRILEQFFKLFYEKKEFTYERSPELIQRMQELSPQEEVSRYGLEIFNGEDYQEIDFNIVVEAGAGTQYSEIMSMQMLDNLYMTGAINNLTTEQLEQYLEMYPQSAVPFKSKMKEIIKAQKESELYQLREAVQQQASQLEQLSQYAQEQEKVVKNLGGQLQKSNATLASLQDEYATKINLLNDQLINIQGNKG